MRSHQSENNINTKGHWGVGIQWPVIGSKSNTYIVEMTDYGFACDCISPRRCKHIKEVEKKFD